MAGTRYEEPDLLLVLRSKMQKKYPFLNLKLYKETCNVKNILTKIFNLISFGFLERKRVRRSISGDQNKGSLLTS
jgi:hypothetical protein